MYAGVCGRFLPAKGFFRAAAAAPHTPMTSRGVGIPVKLLHEAEGHTVTVETLTGETYRPRALHPPKGPSVLPRGAPPPLMGLGFLLDGSPTHRGGLSTFWSRSVNTSGRSEVFIPFGSLSFLGCVEEVVLTEGSAAPRVPVRERGPGRARRGRGAFVTLNTSPPPPMDETQQGRTGDHIVGSAGMMLLLFGHTGKNQYDRHRLWETRLITCLGFQPGPKQLPYFLLGDLG